MEPQQRPGGRSARVREAVLEAALSELGASGWGSLSVERIAERSGVHKTTIYRRWGGADQVALDALLNRGIEGIPSPDTGTLNGDLLALGRLVAATISDPVGRAVATAVLAEPDSPTLSRLAEVFWSQRFSEAGSIVERAIERGEVSVSTDADGMIEAIASQIWFRIMMRRGVVTDDWLSTVVERAIDRSV